MPIQRPIFSPFRCPYCRQKLTLLVRVVNGFETQNTTMVCANKNCIMGINVEEIKTWQVKLDQDN